jgi:hypothetical protein
MQTEDTCCSSLQGGCLRASCRSFGLVVGTHATCVTLHCICADLWHSHQSSSLYTLQFLCDIVPVYYQTSTVKSACVMCLLAIISSPCHSIKHHSFVLDHALKFHVTVTLWNNYSCTTAMWKVSIRFQHKFQDITVSNTKLFLLN